MFDVKVATAVWYIFFCALVEEKLYTIPKRRGGLYKYNIRKERGNL